MSSRSSVESVEVTPTYEWEHVAKLAASLAYQEVRDSPIIPYYTDWKTLQRVETARTATRTLPPPLPPGVDEGRVDVYLGAPGDYRIIKGKHLVRSDLPYWGVPIDGRMAALHALRWHDGAVIEDPGDYLVVLAGGDGYTGHHVEVIVPEGSTTRLVVMEATPRGGLSSRSFKIRVGKGSSLDITVITMDAGPAYLTGLITLEEAASVTERILVVPGEMTHLKLDTVLNGGKSLVNVRASTVAIGKVRSDLITNILIMGPESESTLDHWGVSGRGAFAVHRGSARITRRGKWSAAKVESTFMTLDDSSVAVSVPILEVETGDVRDARHSTVVALPPEDALFYMAQRGLSREEAMMLIEEGVLEGTGIHEVLNVDLGALFSWVTRLVKAV